MPRPITEKELSEYKLAQEQQQEEDRKEFTSSEPFTPDFSDSEMADIESERGDVRERLTSTP